MPEAAKGFSIGWISKVVAYNLCTMLIIVGGWHWFTYVSDNHKGMQKGKFNPVNQYEKKDPASVRMFTSSSGNLEREIFYTTLGWLQSSAWQCFMMRLWASGKLPYYTDFWSVPAWSLFHLAFVTYWREFHFYWCHRMIHPWWSGTLATGDLGSFLYKHVHSLHHRSYNPGPWSGLSMHPVEHFFYYTCTLLPLFFRAHPLHFLYAKFHADIAPIGGHDGYELEGGDFHWVSALLQLLLCCYRSNAAHKIAKLPALLRSPHLGHLCFIHHARSQLHHAKYECNYGVPLMDFDRMFGTCVEVSDYREAGSLKGARELARQRKNGGKVESASAKKEE
jgi:sterol desaturase/sphingolipid hydroxylase (fatty acid hydroxylase superfamily)